MTADEFMKLLNSEEQRLELLDGELIDMPSGGPNHEQSDKLSTHRRSEHIHEAQWGAPIRDTRRASFGSSLHISL